jgi:hypothetical protein
MENEYIRRLAMDAVSGLIIVPAITGHEARSVYDILVEKGIPFVFCNRCLDGLPAAPLVCSNGFYGAYIACKHLMERGYRRIAFVAANRYIGCIERYNGYAAALAEAGLSVDERIVTTQLPGDGDETVIGCATRMLESDNPPDAFFCFNDRVATRVYRAITRKGLRISEDIGLMGYDNSDLCEICDVKLTSVDYRTWRSAAGRRPPVRMNLGEHTPAFTIHTFMPRIVGGRAAWASGRPANGRNCMNAKQRVNAALEFRPPDRVPYGEYAIDSAVAGKILGHETYLRNKAKRRWRCGRAGGMRCPEPQGGHGRAVQKAGRGGHRQPHGRGGGASAAEELPAAAAGKIAEGTWRDREGHVYKYTAAAETSRWWRTPRSGPAPTRRRTSCPKRSIKPDPSQFEVIDYVARRLGGEKYLIGPAGREVGLTLLGNMERGFVEMGEEPGMVEQIARQLTEVGRLEDEDYIRPGCDAVMWGQDFSCNRGPMVSPEMFRRMAAPFCRERTAQVHARGLKVFKHACGNNWALLDAFLEIGYDAYQSIQHSAGMTLPALRAAAGDRLCLWGGITLDYLMDGRLEAAKRDVREAVELGRGGGVIWGHPLPS